jgi:hypothetical protein
MLDDNMMGTVLPSRSISRSRSRSLVLRSCFLFSLFLIPRSSFPIPISCLLCICQSVFRAKIVYRGDRIRLVMPILGRWSSWTSFQTKKRTVVHSLRFIRWEHSFLSWRYGIDWVVVGVMTLGDDCFRTATGRHSLLAHTGTDLTYLGCRHQPPCHRVRVGAC